MTIREKYIKLVKSQLGYKETGINNTKYSRWFDNEGWQFFNYKKNGNPGTEWCSIFLLWALCQNDVGLGRDKVRSFLGLPAPKYNAAAGVRELWDYLVKKGYKVDKTKGQPGDFIFFNNKSHVGMIEKVEGGKYYTIEGNKNNKVSACSYAISSSSIYGVCHPKWENVEPKPTPEPVPVPTPTPTPVPPSPKPTVITKKVTAKSGLWLHSKPNSLIVTRTVCMGYGDTFMVSKTSNGFCYGTWVKKGKKGYASAKYLK